MSCLHPETTATIAASVMWQPPRWSAVSLHVEATASTALRLSEFTAASQVKHLFLGIQQ